MIRQLFILSVFFVYFNSFYSLAQTESRSILSSNTCVHVIGNEFYSHPYKRTLLTIYESDSTQNIILVDTIFSSKISIILTSDSYENEIRERYPRSFIVKYPSNLYSSKWTIEFISGDLTVKKDVYLMR